MSRYRSALSLWLIASGVCLISMPVLVATPAPSSSVNELRQKVIAFAGGPGALDKVRTLAFDFVAVDEKTKTRAVHHHAYDREKGVWRYEISLADFAKTPFWNKAAGDRWAPDPNVPKGKQLVAIFDHYPRLEGTVYVDGKPQSGEENTRLLQRVNDSIDNDRYWMFLPLLIANPAVRLDPAPPVEEKNGRLQGFTAYSGENKAENRTLWTLYLTPKGELVRSDVMILHNPAPAVVLWEKWKQFGPVRIALEHAIPKMNRALLFEHVVINKPVNTEPPR